MIERRRLIQAAVLVLPLPAAAGWLGGPETKDLEVGSSVSAVLEAKSSSRLKVRMKLKEVRTTQWVDARSRRVVDTLTQHRYENNYGWEESVNVATDVWQLLSDDLTEPTLVVLRVRARDAQARVGFFAGVPSASDLDPDKGVYIPPTEEDPLECLGRVLFQPGLKHFVTVQAQQAEDLAYRISAIKANRFLR